MMRQGRFWTHPRFDEACSPSGMASSDEVAGSARLIVLSLMFLLAVPLADDLEDNSA